MNAQHNTYMHRDKLHVFYHAIKHISIFRLLSVSLHSNQNSMSRESPVSETR